METKTNQQRLPEVKLSYSFKVAKENRTKVTSSLDAYQALLKTYDPNTLDYRESFIILLLNRGNQVLGSYRISEGGISGTVADVKMIFQAALLSNTSGVILSHNHPSGTLHPSQADIDLTRKIKHAAQHLEIQILDHLIMTSGGFLSYL